MRYEGGHLFFAVVLNTVTPTIHKSKISRRGSLRAVRFSSPPCALSRLYKGFRVFNPLLNIYIMKQGSTKQTAVQLNAEGVPRSASPAHSSLASTRSTDAP